MRVHSGDCILVIADEGRCVAVEGLDEGEGGMSGLALDGSGGGDGGPVLV